MSKKSIIIILFLSTGITIIGPIIAFALGVGTISDGFPLKWSSFSFLGTGTNYIAIIIDILFWFAIIFGIKEFVLTKKPKK